MTIPEAEQVVREGWRVVGDAEYCPECSRTWEDRNGREIPSSETISFIKMATLMVVKERKMTELEKAYKDGYAKAVDDIINLGKEEVSTARANYHESAQQTGGIQESAWGALMEIKRFMWKIRLHIIEEAEKR